MGRMSQSEVCSAVLLQGCEGVLSSMPCHVPPPLGPHRLYQSPKHGSTQPELHLPAFPSGKALGSMEMLRKSATRKQVRVFDNLPALTRNGLLRPIHHHQWSSNKLKAMLDNATASDKLQVQRAAICNYIPLLQTKSAVIGARGLEECLDLADILFLQALPVDQWSHMVTEPHHPIKIECQTATHRN